MLLNKKQKKAEIQVLAHPISLSLCRCICEFKGDGGAASSLQSEVKWTTKSERRVTIRFYRKLKMDFRIFFQRKPSGITHAKSGSSPKRLAALPLLAEKVNFANNGADFFFGAALFCEPKEKAILLLLFGLPPLLFFEKFSMVTRLVKARSPKPRKDDVYCARQNYLWQK